MNSKFKLNSLQNYFGDLRDWLEAAYPSSTSFCHCFDGCVNKNSFTTISKGITIVINKACLESLRCFALVAYSLEDSIDWEQFTWHVYSFHSLEGEVKEKLTSVMPINGVGEIFAIKEGEPIFGLAPPYTMQDFEDKFSSHIQRKAKRP